ncbi:VOC family protein [Microbulbifer sp. 2201CG32-9]|uniref:VOC family protein n=1 Tax=Microbulbifer sp. 2201CG32-9 TaxID=3232309 RepID=UPI00345C591B
MDSKIVSLGQLALTMSNVQLALEFYRDILGLEFLFSPVENLAFLQSGETRIMLTTPQGAGEPGNNSIPYFKVSNIVEFYDSVLTKGAIAEREPQIAAQMPDHELWIGFIKDPESNLIGLMEEK